MNHFAFSIKLETQQNGWILVSHPDVPEASTEGETEKEALEEAQDCLIGALGGYIARGWPIPVPLAADGNAIAELPEDATLKLSLYTQMHQKSITAAMLAERLGKTEIWVGQLLDLDEPALPSNLADAINALPEAVRTEGYRLVARSLSFEADSGWRLGQSGLTIPGSYTSTVASPVLETLQTAESFQSAPANRFALSCHFTAGGSCMKLQCAIARCVLLLTLMIVGNAAAIAAEPNACANCLSWRSPLVVVQIIWMFLVTAGAAFYSRSISKKNGEVVNEGELRGLNLPRGSLRGILALATIGSFVNVMVLGAPVLGDSFDNVLAAFGTLTGSIIGFYFGARGATPKPNGQ